MKIDVLRVEGDTVHSRVEMTREEFGRYVMWKQIDEGMTYDACTAWLERDFPTFRDLLTTMTVTDSDGGEIPVGARLWVLKPETVTMTVRFAP